MVGGVVSEGRLCVLASPVLCVVSPFCWRGGPVEWREWRVLCCPSCLVLSPSSSQCPAPPFPLRVMSCLLWAGKCGGVCCLHSVCGIVLWRVQHCYRIVLCCCVVCGEEEGGVCYE